MNGCIVCGKGESPFFCQLCFPSPQTQHMEALGFWRGVVACEIAQHRAIVEQYAGRTDAPDCVDVLVNGHACEIVRKQGWLK